MKALKYLKPFWLSVLIIIGLTYAQVQCSLALPDYMSDIITDGIQYGGITDAMPEAMRETTFERLAYFVEGDTYASLLEAYTYVAKGDESYVSTYPEVQNEAIYVLTDKETDLDGATGFLKESLLANEEICQQMGISSPEALFAMMASDPETAAAVNTALDRLLEGYTDDNLEDASRLAVKSEYAALGMDTAKIQSDYILNRGVRMLGIAFIGSLCAIGAAYLSGRTASGAARDMRGDVFRKVESFANEEFSRFSTASLITRTTNDIQQIQQILTMMLRIVLLAPIMGFTALFKVMRYPSMLNILGWVVAAITVLLLSVFLVTLPKFKMIQKLVDRLNLVTREQLEGMLVVRAFDNQKVEEERFDKANKDITNVNIFVNRVMALMSPVMTFMMSSVSLLIIWFGSTLVDAGTMPIGDMLAFMQYAMEVLMSFMIISLIFIMIPRSAVSANRVFEVLETEPAIRDPENPVALPLENKEIRFNHVGFIYPGAEEKVLSDIDFIVNPGETIAFIGSTGSGKSTLINLLPRFFDVSEGSIEIGGIDIRNVRQHDLRDHIGYVPQKGVLFSGTVASNLKYADKNASEETMEEALTISQAKEFVDQMPHGINEPIAQGGTNVSGGQKQRLSIARALTKKANIYIFDDTFSALDYATDAALREALNQMIKRTKATVFIVAQRISTIRQADKIVVLDKGRIAGMGTHDELMDKCDVYREIAYSQLSKKELGYE